VAHGFADAQLSLRAAGSGILRLVMARHCRLSKSSRPALAAGIDVFLLNQLRRGWPE